MQPNRDDFPGGLPHSLSFSFCFRVLRLLGQNPNTAKALETSRGISPLPPARQAPVWSDLPQGPTFLQKAPRSKVFQAFYISKVPPCGRL